jgi:HEPN domain-containing protein
MKAVYQHKGLLFRYTHDLEELGEGLEDSSVPIPSVVKEATILTRYAFETRYPGPFETVTEEEYLEAIRLAEAVVSWAEEVIGDTADEQHK